MLITLGVAKKGNGCKLDSAICNTFKGKKWSCPEAFNLKTGVPLRNLRRTCSMSLVFTTPALKRKAVEHPEGVVFWRLWMKHSATEYLQCVWLFFTQHVFFFRIPNKLHLHVKYISYVFYIYIHTPICIYIYLQFTNTPKPSSKKTPGHSSFVLFHPLQGGRRVRTSEVGSAGEVLRFDVFF